MTRTPTRPSTPRFGQRPSSTKQIVVTITAASKAPSSDGRVIIESDDRPVGIVTDRDLVLEPRAEPNAVTVAGIVTLGGAVEAESSRRHQLSQPLQLTYLP